MKGARIIIKPVDAREFLDEKDPRGRKTLMSQADAAEALRLEREVLAARRALTQFFASRGHCGKHHHKLLYRLRKGWQPQRQSRST